MRSRLLLALAVLSLASAPAFALPGDYAAVIARCGEPPHEATGTSPVTLDQQRSLIYNDVILHFEPQGGGWGFTTGWANHLPIFRGEVESRMPCFRQAMLDSAAAAQTAGIATDPTIAAEQPKPAFNPEDFGIPHFWMMAVLVLITILVVSMPSRRERSRKEALLNEPRPYRKPQILLKARRRHIDPDLYV